jgi:hypothetical protein
MNKIYKEKFILEIEYPVLLREDQFVDKGRGHSTDRKMDIVFLEASQTPFFDIHSHLVNILVTRRITYCTGTE